jgi:hypothetical protein
MKQKFKKGDQVTLKKPLRLTVEYIELESVTGSQFHGHIKIWGNVKEISRPRDFFRNLKSFGGVVYETPETLKYIKNLVKQIKKQDREEDKNEKDG